ncbi:MAG: type IV pilus modification protein PilV [Burkholderiales bacterium RIFCSPLOWO2_12_FULL_65_40]|nr:MAG: type IV pilus modification protein PilV [Burkholderiales bacterium RIFCSPLOWO2_12_FULL_65_40]
MTTQNATQQGVALIEALIAMLIVAFGVLGFVGLQARTTVANLEGYQRSQALILVNDMAERMNLNRANAMSYVSNNIGATDPGNCSGSALTAAQKDLCEWAALIRGAAETQGSTQVGAMLNARGCITNPAANQYLLALAWQGVQASGAPVNTCGKDAYSSEDMRRVVTVVVQIANLSPPAAP